MQKLSSVQREQTLQVLSQMALTVTMAVDAYPVFCMRLGQLAMAQTEDPAAAPQDAQWATAVEDLRRVGREYGVALVTLARSLQAQASAWAQLGAPHDPMLLLPTARELGQCYLLISAMEGVSGLEHLPLVSQEEFEALMTDEVQAWLVSHGQPAADAADLALEGAANAQEGVVDSDAVDDDA